MARVSSIHLSGHAPSQVAPAVSNKANSPCAVRSNGRDEKIRLLQVWRLFLNGKMRSVMLRPVKTLDATIQLAGNCSKDERYKKSGNSDQIKPEHAPLANGKAMYFMFPFDMPSQITGVGFGNPEQSSLQISCAGQLIEQRFHTRRSIRLA